VLTDSARCVPLRVGVVGLGGVGSVVCAQLAHLGVGEIIAVDGDRVEASNVSRIFGVQGADIGNLHKTEVARRYIGQIGMPVTVRTVERYLERRDDARSLAECDVIFSCVDRHTPRALLNRLAYEALVPMIDMGSGFRWIYPVVWSVPPAASSSWALGGRASRAGDTSTRTLCGSSRCLPRNAPRSPRKDTWPAPRSRSRA